MGKAVRVTKVSAAAEKAKRNPLYFEIKNDENSGILSTKSLNNTEEYDDEELNESAIPEKTTKKIFNLSRIQQVEEEYGSEEDELVNNDPAKMAGKFSNQDVQEEDADWYDEDGDDELIEISAEDEEMLNKYMIHVNGESSNNLAGMIMDKIKEAEVRAAREANGPHDGISAKIVEVYTQYVLYSFIFLYLI
jgi:hypothetical protein